MTINPNHFPTLDRCKKLKEIGFPEPRFEYAILGDMINYQSETGNARYIDDMHTYIPCPSVMEMLDVMQVKVCEENKYYWLDTFFVDTGGPVCVRYRTISEYDESEIQILKFTEGTLPNALADMIIWLVENKYLTLNK